MLLSAGMHLGSYEILAPIGAGGMGEVYKARDTKLDRDVAIKVLPTTLARDPERLARFEREAKVLAALNHPNIAQIYVIHEGIGESDAGRALVMELVPGRTLRVPLVLGEALRIAGQVAEALEAAHDKGIIHRDLKPANIMITPAGVVKVLDFGLAAITQPSATASGDPSNSPTLTMGATQEGMVLGTAGYMSPEQAGGQALDKRTDIWSFGAVFWEMLTGQRLFTGDTIAHILASVLRAPIDFDKLPSATPRVIRDLVKRCLDRDVKTRLRDIGEARIAIQNMCKEPEGAVSTAHASRLGWVAWGVAVLAIVYAVDVSFLHFREQAPQERSLRFQIPLPENVSDADQRISPDGHYLVFSEPGTQGHLWVRPLNSMSAQPLAGTQGANYPFWSPDSKSIGFFAGGQLKRIEIAGGPALALADMPAGRGGTWGRDGNSGGVILFAPTRNSPIMRIPQGGGIASPVTQIRPGEVSHRLPWFLPDGRHFFYSVTHEGNSDHNTIHMGDIASTGDHVIGEADSEAIYSQGLLLFLRQETLIAQPFDARRGVATGEAAPLEQQIQRRLTTAYADFSASTDGLLAFRTGSAGGTFQLTWVDRSGKQLGLLGEPDNINDFEFSPDRKNVAAAVAPGGTINNGNIWIYDAARGLRTRFTFDPAVDSSPVWSPDGRSIIFASRRKQHADLYRKSADGTGTEELLYSSNLEKTPTSWSPDDMFLLYHTTGAVTGSDVWVLPLTPERPGAPLKPFPFAQSSFNEISAQFSPDGKWVAYVSNESQRAEVYMKRFPGANGKRQISVGGGVTPRWRRDGKEIFYVGPDSRLMSAALIVKGDAIEVGELRPLFGPVASANLNYRYDVSADGRRFLIMPPTQASAEGVTVVQNWTAGLNK